MGLKEKYLAAGESSYVGKVRSQQAAIGTDGNDKTGVTRGVDFMDGTPKKSTDADQIQDNFIRNSSGDFLNDGGGKIAGTYAVSRWLAAGLSKLDSLSVNNVYTTLVKGDVRNAAGTIMQKYTSLTNNKFIDLNTSAKNRTVGPAVGPSPAGLQG